MSGFTDTVYGFIGSAWVYGLAVLVVVVLVVFVVGQVRMIMSGDGHFGIIEAYVGFVRHGKTMLAVQDCVELARARGAILASNIAIFAEGVDTKLIGITDDGLDLDELYVLALQCREAGVGLVLLIDEAGIVMPARQWQSFPVGLMWLLQQSGKLMVEIRYTVQHPLFADTILRSLTAVVHNVRATPPPSIRRRIQSREADADPGRWVGRFKRWYYRPWWFRVTTTVPTDFGTEKAEKVMWSRKVNYRRENEGSYDTDAAILPAGRLKGAADFMEKLNRAKATLPLPALSADDMDPRAVEAIKGARSAELVSRGFQVFEIARERQAEAFQDAP